MAEKKNKTLEKARREMNYLTGDEEVRRLAELREKWEMDYNSGINYAKKEGEKEKMFAKSIDKIKISQYNESEHFFSANTNKIYYTWR